MGIFKQSPMSKARTHHQIETAAALSAEEIFGISAANIGEKIFGDLLGGGRAERKSREKIAKEERRLSRDEILINLVLERIALDLDNQRRQQRLEFNRPFVQQSIMRTEGPNPLTQSRAGAAQRSLQAGTFNTGANVDPTQLGQLIDRSFEGFRQQRERARQLANSVPTQAPQALDPLQQLGQVDPELLNELLRSRQDFRQNPNFPVTPRGR